MAFTPVEAIHRGNLLILPGDAGVPNQTLDALVAFWESYSSSPVQGEVFRRPSGRGPTADRSGARKPICSAGPFAWRWKFPWFGAVKSGSAMTECWSRPL